MSMGRKVWRSMQYISPQRHTLETHPFSCFFNTSKKSWSMVMPQPPFDILQLLCVASICLSITIFAFSITIFAFSIHHFCFTAFEIFSPNSASTPWFWRSTAYWNSAESCPSAEPAGGGSEQPTSPDEVNNPEISEVSGAALSVSSFLWSTQNPQKPRIFFVGKIAGRLPPGFFLRFSILIQIFL